MQTRHLGKIGIALLAVVATVSIAYARLNGEFGASAGNLPTLDRTTGLPSVAAGGTGSVARSAGGTEEPGVETGGDGPDAGLTTDAFEASAGEGPLARRGPDQRAREVDHRTTRERSRELLRTATDNADAVARSTAVEALLGFGAVAALLDVVASEATPLDTRQEALDAIEELKPVDEEEVDRFENATTPVLISALDDPNPEIYEEAAYLLETSDDPGVPPALWDKFESYVQGDYDRAEIILATLDFLGEEVDEAWELLDYYDPTDWDTAAKERVAQGWTPVDCQSFSISCAGE